MYTTFATNLAEYDKLIHVAFGCGCVRTFTAGEKTQVVMPRCVQHGDAQVSTTEEFIPRQKTA